MSQFIEVIECLDRSPETIVSRFPAQGSAEIKLGAQLVVRESQAAIFFRDGRALDTFGAGRHTLTTLNIPLITKTAVAAAGRREPVPHRGLLREPAQLREPEVGHDGADPVPRQRARHGPAARVRDLLVPDLEPAGVRELAGRHRRGVHDRGGRRLLPRPDRDPGGRLPRLAPAHGARPRAALRRDLGRHPGARARRLREVRRHDRRLQGALDLAARPRAGDDRQARRHGRRRLARQVRAVPGGQRAREVGAGRAAAADSPPPASALARGSGSARAWPESSARARRESPAPRTVRTPASGSVAAGANFCSTCGTRQRPATGELRELRHANAAGSRFCANCGTGFSSGS